jgi:hypothetical protein
VVDKLERKELRSWTKVVGPDNSRQQDKGEGSVRGSGGAVLNNNIKEARGGRPPGKAFPSRCGER